MGRISSLATKRLWIFDLDGTLTCPKHDFIAIRQQLGVPEGGDILDWIGAQPAPLRQALERELDAIETAVACSAKIAPGAKALLDWLSAQGAVCAILTRNSAESAALSLQQIGLQSAFFWVLAREHGRPKPHPEGVEQLIRRAKVRPSQTVMVGDHLHDLMAGRAAGVATVHVDHRLKFAWSQWADEEYASLEALLTRVQSDR